jgi:putative PEP-CTERM system histidine kinase
MEGQSNFHHEVGADLTSVTSRQISRPFELRESKEKWMETLRQMSVGRFRTGGVPLCVPLVAGENWLGFIILADRVGGIRYTAEELDLLKCIGDQVAVNLLNLELTKEKMAGKELEAFQTISAFFIHDLKNAASTLSLMLQNLPVHFDDPLFRQDALRGIGSTADRINHLISRLGALRHEPQLKFAKVDLNRIVSESLSALNGALQSNLQTDLAPLEKISGDEEQLKSVTTNLFLNAGEAIEDGGEIRVETKQEGQWAILSILDNGCGMSPAFMKDSLFRPFRTTKKKGLGIGMFQAKIIIEAHGGKIEIKSDVGVGTTVRVMLPSARAHQ